MSPKNQADLFTDTPSEVAGGMEIEAMSTQQVVVVDKVTKANLARLLEDAEALVEFSKKISDLAIKRTSNQDWVLFGDKPYLTESGVKKTLALCGANTHSTTIEKEIVNEKSGNVVIYFMAQGKIDFNGKTYENVGTSSTKDKFFAERTRKEDDKSNDPPKYKKGDKYVIDVDEVDIPSVRKKSVTNLQHRLLDMVLKLNPTKEQLKELGIEPAAGFKFAQGSKGGATDTKDEKELRTEIKTLVNRYVKDEGKSEADVVQWATSFEGKNGGKDFAGYKTVDRISVKMLKGTLEKLHNLDKE